jgi:plastocyanin
MAPVETTLPAELETAVTTAPSAVATESTDMGDMAGMEDEANATQAPADPAGAATATPAADQGASNGSATQVQGTLREWAIDLSQQEVPAGKVIFTVTNTGQNTHNFAVEDSTGALIAKTPNFGSRDGAQTLELDLAPGTYTIICSLPGHAARGQRTQLVVK